MKSSIYRCLCFFALSVALPGAEVPNLINHQGRVAVDGVNFDGIGKFKFALIDGPDGKRLWSHDGTTGDGEPQGNPVELTVTKGLYSVILGDPGVEGMSAIQGPEVFRQPDVRLRIWFDDGSNGFQQLEPDQRLAPNGYLPDGSVRSEKIAANAVTAGKIAPGAVGSAHLASGAAAPPTVVASPAWTAVANSSYVANSAARVLFTLPSTANVGDAVHISGAGTGGWEATGFDPDAWTPRASNRTWKSIASSADGTKLIAVAGRGNLHKSIDSGVTWTELAIPNPTTTLNGVASSSDGQRLFAVAGDFSVADRIYTSADSGQSWTPSGVFSFWNGVACSADGRRAVAITLSRIYTSEDYGQNWTGGQNRSWRGVASSSDGMKLVAIAADGIFTSADAGATWISRGGEGLILRGVASSSDGTKLVVVPHLDRIRVSQDSGNFWASTGEPLQWRGVASSADGTKLAAVVAGGRIYVSNDSGVTWAPRESGRNWACVAASVDGTKLIAGDSGGRLYTDDGGGFAGASIPLVGDQGTAATLRYTGNGQWRVVNPPPGTITGEQLEDRSVRNEDFADGAVSLQKLAPNIGVWEVSGLSVYRAGSVGIGTAAPNFPLSFGGSAVNTKLALWDGGTTAYGLGIQPFQFRFHVDAPAARFSFLDAPAGNEVMTIMGTGNVGIGRPDPLTRLHVVGNTDTEISIECTEAGGRRWTVQSSGSVFPPLAGSFQIIDRTAGVSRLAVMPNGNIGLSRAPAANRLEVEGDASKSTAGAWLANSDRRIKTDVQPVTNALETIDKVRPVTFRYTEEYRKAHPDIKDVPYYNVIAQEFREVFPNAVKASGENLPDGSEILQVDTYPATITAIAAIKELRAENAELKRRLAALEESVRRMQTPDINTEVTR